MTTPTPPGCDRCAIHTRPCGHNAPFSSERVAFTVCNDPRVIRTMLDLQPKPVLKHLSCDVCDKPLSDVCIACNKPFALVWVPPQIQLQCPCATTHAFVIIDHEHEHEHAHSADVKVRFRYTCSETCMAEARNDST